MEYNSSMCHYFALTAECTDNLINIVGGNGEDHVPDKDLKYTLAFFRGEGLDYTEKDTVKTLVCDWYPAPSRKQEIALEVVLHLSQMYDLHDQRFTLELTRYLEKDAKDFVKLYHRFVSDIIKEKEQRYAGILCPDPKLPDPTGDPMTENESSIGNVVNTSEKCAPRDYSRDLKYTLPFIRSTRFGTEDRDHIKKIIECFYHGPTGNLPDMLEIVLHISELYDLNDSRAKAEFSRYFGPHTDSFYFYYHRAIDYMIRKKEFVSRTLRADVKFF